MPKLNGIKIAILVTDGFEQSELVKPRAALDAEGAITKIISPKKDRVRGWQHGNWADEIKVDVHLFQAKPQDYDALLLPGGVMNPDHLRMIPQVIDFIKHFVQEKKPIAAICHGPWTLINADALKGRTLTSWPSIKQDLINAGANWLDKESVRDGNLVTSRKPDDIPAFNRNFIALLAEAQ